MTRAVVVVALLGSVLAGGCARVQARDGAAAMEKPGYDVPIQRYQEAARSRATGIVLGKVYEERRRPSGPDVPLTGTVVTLLPRSPLLLAALESSKRDARDSLNTYRGAVPAIRRMREAYERTLWERGAPELVLATTVAVDGTFRIEAIPEGEWVVYATRSQFIDKPEPLPSANDQSLFLKRARFLGYSVVTTWIRELRVGAGTSETVELTDRNAWFTGVAEDWDTQPATQGPIRPRPY